MLQANLGRFEDSHKTNAQAQKLLDDYQSIQIPEYRAKALLNKAYSLQGLGRFPESLDSCDAALDLLKDPPSETKSSRLEAQIRFHRAFILGNLERQEEAMQAYERLERDFIRCDDQETASIAVGAVINKSVQLEANGMTDVAIKVLDDLERIHGPSESGPLAATLVKARLNKAALCINLGNGRAATAIATELIDARPPCSPGTVKRAHWIRARSRYLQGNIPGCESDISAALGWVVRHDAQLQRVIRTLILHAVSIGSDRILRLIEDSPSANALTPLAAALRLDLGAAPRVAREVIEVARDIKEELDQVRLRMQRLESRAAQSVPKAVIGGR